MSYSEHFFALELIYYYDTKVFKKGNGLLCLVVQNNEALFRAKQFDWPIKDEKRLIAPGGYIFQIVDRPLPKDKDPISKIIITSTNLQKSIRFWCGFLEMNIMVEKRHSITLSYGKNQARLEIRYISPPFIQGDNTPRLKAVIPYKQLMELQLKFLKMPNRIKQHTTIYAYTKPTNVKIAVFVDYDGHEIAYIDQESYAKVLKYDAESVKTLKLHVRL
ncbi:unnamed protein product [Callosobruchus maculatus]|uniref:Uncharacterized protein n=1 Tax=Callosobruchus maculatus TaxID=64391 RepID=A0A653BJL7_CALMS|nr:unnamed protein product [Callosobruchus maculatus]